MTVTFQDDSQVQLTFGSQVPSSTHYYMLRSDEPSTVYVVESALPEVMSNAVYDMMVLPEIPAMNTLHSIFLSCAGKELIVTYDDSSWLYGSEDVSKNEVLTALVNSLSSLKLAKCENFKPSADGLSFWGMDVPSVIVQVYYDDDQLLNLEIGHKTLDGNGYYVRMNDDTTIYSMDADSIETIIFTAQNGFSSTAAASQN